MAFLSRINPVPRFPAYKGPFNVASIEIEIPVSELLTPSQRTPEAASNISTVQFRVFYPTSRKDASTNTLHRTKSGQAETENEELERSVTNDGPNSKDYEEPQPDPSKPRWGSGWWKGHSREKDRKQVYWLPEPHQREYLSGYARFLGAGSGLAELISYIPRMLHHISLNVVASAPLVSNPPEERFPTVVFSHGLGGTRMAYSYFCASLASSGMIVIAPEHRDGSAPVTFVKDSSKDTSSTKVEGPAPNKGEPGVTSAETTPSDKKASERVQVDYSPYAHEISQTTTDGRNRQLEIRLWELSLIYNALIKLDTNTLPASVAMFDTDPSDRASILSCFQNKLDICKPGRVIWAGHSFGSATMIQFFKSICYSKVLSNQRPLFIPDVSPASSPNHVSLAQQITSSSPLLLLDIWCLPTIGQRTRHLFSRPLPQIGAGTPEKVLVIMSHEFVRWRENLRGVRRILSKDPGRKRGTPEHAHFEQYDSDSEAVYHHPDNDLVTPATEKPPVQLGDQIVPPPSSGTGTPALQGGSHDEKKPGLYYVTESAHLSQSDFGVLFPRVVRKAVGHEEILDMNVVAAVKWIRQCGYEVEEPEVDLQWEQRWKEIAGEE